MHSGYRLLATSAVLTAALASAVQAVPLTTLAFDNATVQVAGPRTGANGKAFFNVEGSNNGAFSSYGVADFNFGSLSLPVLTVNSAELVLTESDAAFSAPGQILIALDVNAVPANIQPGTSPLAFSGLDPGTGTDVSQGDLTLEFLSGGPFLFPLLGTGSPNPYSLALTPAQQSYFVSHLNSGLPIRLIVGTANPLVVGTWAGYTNATWPGPVLNLDVTYDTGVAARTTTWGRLKTLYR